MPQEREAVGAGRGELHALQRPRERRPSPTAGERETRAAQRGPGVGRSEEHTSELQSRLHLVCRLLLEKKKQLPKNILIASLMLRLVCIILFMVLIKLFPILGT